MPGFHEEEEDENVVVDDIEVDASEVPLASRPRPPASEPARSSQETVKVSFKPRSAVNRKAPNPPSSKVSQDCPICGKTIVTDNQGMNDHVDFCLSRGVILQAQSEASVGSSKGASKGKKRTRR